MRKYAGPSEAVHSLHDVQYAEQTCLYKCYIYQCIYTAVPKSPIMGYRYSGGLLSPDKLCHTESNDCFLVASIALQLVWLMCANDECNSSGVRPLDELESAVLVSCSGELLAACRR